MTPTHSSTRWKAVSLGLVLVIIGLCVWDGADRRASDATQPLPHGGISRNASERSNTLKVASFNIHGGKGRDGARDLARTADLLKDLDIVGLYEVRAIQEGSTSNQAASLAQRREMEWWFAPTERQWWSDHFGNGLLSRVPVKSVLRLPLINTRGKAYRNAILTTVPLRERDVQIIAVHIDREADRVAQLRTVIDLFLALQPPCILMGDLNSPETEPLLEELRNHQDVHSPLHEAIPAGPHAGNIDWMLTRGLKTITAALVDNKASDHPVLQAELELDSTP